MERDVTSYINNRNGVYSGGESRNRPNKLNWVPKITSAEEAEMTEFSYLKSGVRVKIGEGVRKVAPGIGEITEVRKDGLVVFVDAKGNEFKMANNSPLLKPENLVE